MNRVKHFFSLIELTVVVIVIGVLTAIVIPNISSSKEDAKRVAIHSESKNIQTAVDMFMMSEDGKYPVQGEVPVLGEPKKIKMEILKPAHLRSSPRDQGFKWWVDHNGTVWVSSVDAPTGVEYDKEEEALFWNRVESAKRYRIYQAKGSKVSASAEKQELTLKEEVDTTIRSGDRMRFDIPKLSEGFYLVSAVDKFDLESPPVKVLGEYLGYGEILPKGDSSEPQEPTVPANRKPIAIISMTPEGDIYTTTTISWNHDKSNDPDNDAITNVEWKLDGNIVSAMPVKLSKGLHLIELRVQDERGEWSEIAGKQIIVTEAPSYSGTFLYTGSTQTFVAPHTGIYKLEVWGAQGGGVQGGKGGYAYGEKHLQKGQSLYIYVGGTATTGNGGWNGGGNGWSSTSPHGGGGATDIRTALGNWDVNLNTRIIVAGGGGSAGNLKPNAYHNIVGGHGGGLNGGNGYGGVYAGKGGTQSSGGEGGTYSTKIPLLNYPLFYTGGSSTFGKAGDAGTFGKGGNGSHLYGTGGGGGYYGGGGGSVTGNLGNNTCSNCGTVFPAGGGSSYIGGVANGGTTSGQRSGLGQATITFVR